ncbi:MAG: 3'-5' exonuclease [Rubrivivax sp.]|jgi:DNA polymerase-3 subunit epsilon|nr:3'-5' exonuclease [Rubrivivax sp.]
MPRWNPFARRSAAADDGRWVVIDVETSGLDPARDRLLAIAGVAVRRQGAAPVIDLADSFEIVLRQGEARPVDRDNILLHGIGVGAQRAGVPPAEALTAFERWTGDAPRIGFHVGFDRAVIERANAAVLGRRGDHRWIDLEPLAAVTHPQVPARALDEWMAHFGITCAARHEAAADALATAELLLRLWPRLAAEGATDAAAMARLAATRRWVAPR